MGAIRINSLKTILGLSLFAFCFQTKAASPVNYPKPANEADVGEVEGVDLNQETRDAESDLFRELLERKRQLKIEKLEAEEENPEVLKETVLFEGAKRWIEKRRQEKAEKRELKRQEEEQSKALAAPVGAAPTVLVEVFKVRTDSKGNVIDSILGVTDAAGEAKEFVLVTLNGVLRHAWVTSTAQSYTSRWASGIGKNVTPSTPEGTGYKPHYLHKEHVSTVYGGGYMPFAIFFNGGIALHSTTDGHYAQLGIKDSGGCSRLYRSNAETLWAYVNPKRYEEISNEDYPEELRAIRNRVTVNVYGFDRTGASTRAALKAQYASKVKWIQSEVRKDLEKIRLRK